MRVPPGRSVPPGSVPAQGDGRSPTASNADDVAFASNTLMRGGVLSVDAATTTGPSGADGLLGRLDALSESHGVLGREYETPLRVFRETLTELRNSQEHLRKQSEEQPKQQKEQMEASDEVGG